MASEGPAQRVSPFTFSTPHELPLGLSEAAPREVRFLLGDDLALLKKRTNLELRTVVHSRAGR